MGSTVDDIGDIAGLAMEDELAFATRLTPLLYEKLHGNPAATAGTHQGHGHAEGRVIPFADPGSKTWALRAGQQIREMVDGDDLRLRPPPAHRALRLDQQPHRRDSASGKLDVRDVMRG